MIFPKPEWKRYLVTYEINAEHDTEQILIRAHGPQMARDIMYDHIVRTVMEVEK